MAEQLSAIDEIDLETSSIETNMVQFSIARLAFHNEGFLQKCQEKGLLLFPWLPTNIRAVLHRPLIEEDVLKAAHIIRQAVLEIELSKRKTLNHHYVS